MQVLASTLISVLLLSASTLISVDAKEQYSNPKMVCLVNRERGKYGLRPLSVNAQLTKAAQGHCDYQAQTRKMSHTGAGGSDPGRRAKQAGYNYNSVGENVAYGYNTMDSVMKTWMNSSGHRANILGKSYTCMGSAVAYSGSTPYYTQLFGAGGGSDSAPPPKCDGSDVDSAGGDYGGEEYGGNEYGGQAGGNEYGGNDYGGQAGGNGGNDYGGQMGGNGGRPPMNGGNDYGGQMGGNGGKKPCNKGRQGGANNSDYGNGKMNNMKDRKDSAY